MHSRGIMHRDIKPFNLLINPQNKTAKIIDFGLSEYYIPGKANSEHVASLYYKGPELLFSNSNYDYRVDIWSAGMILAGMVKYRLFRYSRKLHSSKEMTKSIRF